ncbi:hypothetical protein [Nonomuraea basaltis]|uniref:hypothetical protein n=1 Tax=Nonomuraea basaltis TaxID=2495887 RepID=UPI00110C417A|nr:hypothetical protein [Nonomuraea basaltis]TMR89975.1 hypothetical protein EJK15_57820 [Nonomuraea basaltis]
MAGLVIIYGVAVIWFVLAFLAFASKRIQAIMLSIHVAASGLLAAWLVSMEWAVGMTVIMFGPGAAISLVSLVLMALSTQDKSSSSEQ